MCAHLAYCRAKKRAASKMPTAIPASKPSTVIARNVTHSRRYSRVVIR